MLSYINSPLQLGPLTIENRLIQGPLAGYSCSPFRVLFSTYASPAYTVSEMLSANDVLYKHASQGRYLHRAKEEKMLSYQLSGNNADLLSEAALKLTQLGADIIDINCGCPKSKIRKKGAGSALLEQPEALLKIVQTVRNAIPSHPLTIKIRLVNEKQDIQLAKALENAGINALIIHGRRASDSYNVPCDLQRIALIKQQLNIPIILNGDISDSNSLDNAYTHTGVDAFMISRAGTGKPWLYKELLSGRRIHPPKKDIIDLFLKHLNGLADLETEYSAILQSKSLVRFYFKDQLNDMQQKAFYELKTISQIEVWLDNNI